MCFSTEAIKDCLQTLKLQKSEDFIWKEPENMKAGWSGEDGGDRRATAERDLSVK